MRFIPLLVLAALVVGACSERTANATGPISAPPASEPTGGTLSGLVAASSRTGIREWAEPRSIAEINAAVARLDEPGRGRLAEVVLDTDGTDGTDGTRTRLLTAMRVVLDNPSLGFYAEIWSYTRISMSGDGFHGGCGQIWLNAQAFARLTATATRNVLMHESFHSFNCVNGGPAGALNEGAAIWVYQAAFPADTYQGASLAEATYGTKLYYRDMWDPPQPDYPVVSPAASASPKLVAVLTWLSSVDPSKLPWNAGDRLSRCYESHWSALDRDVDFYGVWLPAARRATQQMVADTACRPIPA